jgi:uncharacterized protein (TIGR02284 family)
MDQPGGDSAANIRLAGGARFSRFLSLAAGAGESRVAGGPRSSNNAIAQTRSQPHGVTPVAARRCYRRDTMATDTAKKSNLEDTVKSVINALEDGQKGMAEIGEHLKDEVLKRYFLAESLKRASFRGELENELHRHGVADVHENGTASGKVYRVWADLKAKLGGGDHTLLETAEQSEDETKEVYKDALDQELPLPLRQLLTEQQAHILTAHDFIRAHRDASKHN